MNRPFGYAIRLLECLESLSSTLTTQPVYSAQLFLFPAFDKPDLNWISDQYCLLEHDVMLAKSNHCAIVIMVLRYPVYFSPYRHWLSTGVCTPGGESARAVDEWKDDIRGRLHALSLLRSDKCIQVAPTSITLFGQSFFLY